MTVAVWAWRPLTELNGQTGFVECDDELAAALLRAGAVDAGQMGHPTMREIVGGEPVAGLPADPPPAPSPAPSPEGTDEGATDSTGRVRKPRGTVVK
jgi:hypothetical protein